MFRQLNSLMIIAVLVSTTSLAQQPRNGSTILAAGNPNLTQRMVDRIESVYEFLLEIRLSNAQREQFQQGVVSYWTRNDGEGMQSILSNLKYADLSTEDLRTFRDTNQATIVENMRRDTDSPEEVVLVQAYDATHPDRRKTTSAKNFNDLVGTWSRSDALLASRDSYSGTVTGVSFTDSGTIEVSANGTFKSVKQHTHCASACCRLDGEEDFGSLTVEGSMLVFQIKGGSKLVQDDCSGSKSARALIAPHRESYRWSIRPNPNTNATMLCWNTDADNAVCYEKQ